MVVYALLVAGTLLCAIQAIRARQLLTSALWLAGVSALVSIILYRLGAQEVAVIELSVGAGLVTVLFVFAISIAGDDAMGAPAVVPRPLAVGMALVFVIILGAMVFPVDDLDDVAVDLTFSDALWDDRALDVLVQIVLIFAGVLGLVAILKDTMVSLTVQHGHGPAGEISEQLAGLSGYGTAAPVEAARPEAEAKSGEVKE